MNYADNINNLEESIKKCRLKTSAELDEKILSDACETLEQSSRLQKKNRRKIFNNIIRLAGAACFIIAALIIAEQYLTKPQKPTKPYEESAGQTSPGEEKPDVDMQKTEQTPIATTTGADRTELDAELNNIMEMFAANDIEGLVTLLSDSPREIKIASAIYLVKIGDSQAADILQKLGSESEDSELSAIFNLAASLINKRLQESQQTEIITAGGQSLYLDGAFIPRGILSGRIADAETSEPVNRINVTLTGARSIQTTTDANGFYYFDKIDQAGQYKIEIRSKNYLAVDDENLTDVSLRNDSNTVRHFSLIPACRINITVVNESNEPVQQAYVYETRSLTFPEYGKIKHLYGSAESTDANGQVILGAFQASSVIPRIFNATHSDYAPAQIVATLDNHKNIPSQKIVMKQGMVIEGFAEYKDGNPAENVKIFAEPLGRQQLYNLNSGYADDKGLFTLSHISAGQYRIKAYIKDPANPRHTDTITCMTTQLPPEGNILNVRIPKKSPQNLAAISGKVTATGQIKRVRVTASSEDGSYGKTYIPEEHYMADPNDPNSFIIHDLEPGIYTLEFSGRNIKDKTIENIQAPADGLVVQLETTEPPQITAYVVGPDSPEPIKNFEYRVGYRNWHKVYDSNGLISTTAPGPGIYQLQVLAEGFAPAWSEPIDTNNPQTSLIILSRGGTITGTVSNSQGELISGAQVISLSTADDISETGDQQTFLYQKYVVETDNLGRFTLENLPVGIESLKVTCPTYADYITEQIEVKEGRVTGDVEIVLQTGGIVEGYVYDPDGRSQQNVTLYFYDKAHYPTFEQRKAGLLAKAVTDTNGFYQIEGLNEQLCYVGRNISYSSAIGVISRTIVPQKGVVSRLDFGGEGSVTGRMILNGLPVAGSLLILTGPNEKNLDLNGFTCCCLTDAEGRFEFNGVPAGVYSVFCQDPQDISGWFKTATLRMGFEDTNLGQIPRQLCSIEVFAPDTNDPNLTVASVYLKEGTEFWGERVGKLAEPSEANQPLIINDVLPGSYTVYVRRSDSVTFLQPVIVTDETQRVTIELPSATSEVRGIISDEISLDAILFSEDKKVADYFKADANGMFRIKNLPGGRYFICEDSEFPTEQTALQEFELADGEEKVIDIDTATPLLPVATLNTLVIDENGVPINGAEVWLEGYSEIIEPLQNSYDGQFFITQPGIYSLHAVYEGYKPATQDITLEATDKLESDSKDILFIKLERATL